MAGIYQAWLTDDYGLRLASLDNNLGFDASRIVNGIGWINMRLPQSFNTNYIAPDRMIQLWRQPEGGRLSLWRIYFLRKYKYSTGENGQEEIYIAGPDINDLLRRRIVLGYAGTSYTSKSDYADDLMKEVVTQSLSDSIEPTPDAGTRAWNNLNIETDFSIGPSVQVEMAWDKLLTESTGGILIGINKASRDAGTETFFDIVVSNVTSTTVSFEFRTYINQPGEDATDEVVFDKERGNLKNPELEFDWSDEENYIYAAGQGQGTLRNVQQVYDSNRYGLSQWNRCEGFGDFSNIASNNALQENGRRKLREGQPRRNFTGTPVDTKGTRFGRNWDIGYKVRTIYKDLEFDSIIRSVVIHVNQDGRENIETRLEYED